jgi:hypothetical protein
MLGIIDWTSFRADLPADVEERRRFTKVNPAVFGVNFDGLWNAVECV